MHILYLHGLGGSLRVQPEIEAVFLPAGFRVVRIPLPYHDNPLELFGRLATLTFADLCQWIHEGAERLIRTAQLFAPEEYAVIGGLAGRLHFRGRRAARLPNKSLRSAGLQRRYLRRRDADSID